MVNGCHVRFMTARRNFPLDTDGTSRIWLAGGYDSTGVPMASMEMFAAAGNRQLQRRRQLQPRPLRQRHTAYAYGDINTYPYGPTTLRLPPRQQRRFTHGYAYGHGNSSHPPPLRPYSYADRNS